MIKLRLKVCMVLFCVCIFGVFAQGDANELRYPMPEPKYSVRVERSVMVPMRDGVRLSTDLYFPEGVEGKLPVIMVRTPYNKDIFYKEYDLYKRQWQGPYIFAGQGYVVAVQDCRGRFASEGEFLVSANEPKDGYDAVTWLATQPWSNGNVGTYGCSYMGENQIAPAKLRNPHLKALITQSA